MSQPFHLNSLPSRHRRAYYGLLFQMALADGSFDEQEIELIEGLLDIESLDEADRKLAHSYRQSPPSFRDGLRELADASDELKHGVLAALIDVAQADGVVTASERDALASSAEVLNVARVRLEVMMGLLPTIRESTSKEGPSDLDRLRGAAQAWSEAGLPSGAAYFTGTVQRLANEGREAELSALGLGLGMVPGIGVVVALGSLARVGVSELLNEDTTAEVLDESSRRGRALSGLEQLKSEANLCAARLEDPALVADANHRDALEKRLAGLRALIATRRSAIED